jgi:type VI secretion system protein ImpH
MADARGTTSRPLGRRRAAELDELLARVERAPYEFAFLQLMRRVQHLAGDCARLGEGERPASEPLRLGQDPSLGFAPAELSRLVPGSERGLPRLLVNFFGTLGPNGPLPLHITEYARDRLRNHDDPTMSRFLDVFHHRMLMFFFRAWAGGQPTVSRDRTVDGRADDRFETYVGALEGLGLATLRGRDAFPDQARLFYAGRFAAHSRNAEGLAAVVGEFFAVPARVQPFMRDWLDLPPPSLWRLGRPGAGASLGVSSILGARVATRQSKFRLVLGPLDRGAMQRLLPGGTSLAKLTALVRHYVGAEMRWDVRLVPSDDLERPGKLGVSLLGWTSWLGRVRPEDAGRHRRVAGDLILDPLRDEQRRAA